MLAEAEITRIMERIVAGYQPLAAGIFGSYAIGQAHERSDLDILVIKDSAESRFERGRGVRRLLFGIFHPLDIHVFQPEEFEIAAREDMSFEWVIAKQARLYFFRPALATRAPCLASAPRLLLAKTAVMRVPTR